MNDKNSKIDSRRMFLKNITTGSIIAVAGLGLYSCKQASNEKTTLLTPEGKLVQVANSEIEEMEHLHNGAPPNAAREGIPGQKSSSKDGFSFTVGAAGTSGAVLMKWF